MKTGSIHSRKEDHVMLTVTRDVQVKGLDNGFQEFEIVPTAIPDINFSDISIETTFLGRTFSAPLLIAGMTGGYDNAVEINRSLAKICSRLNIPMGVGSQRAMIVNPKVTDSYNVKTETPGLFLIGNLGLVQFCEDFTENEFQVAQEKIDADAMALHVNSFQELCQPEGDLNWKDAWKHLEHLCKVSKVPVIGKEVGSGIAWEEVKRLQDSGCAAIDVGGAGGTSWAKIELMRNKKEDALSPEDPMLKWGISTALATWEATATVKVPIIATGGMYYALEATKALAMGSINGWNSTPGFEKLDTRRRKTSRSLSKAIYAKY